MRVARRGYLETPTPGKDAFMCSGAISNHLWKVELYKGVLEFRAYAGREVEGLGFNILQKMHSHPETQREKAFSALLYLKAAQVNTMLLWEDDFLFEVF